LNMYNISTNHNQQHYNTSSMHVNEYSGQQYMD
jgi:hypothetical protein